ncbi:unnamed protein product, partial [Pylaiella littoralis]
PDSTQHKPNRERSPEQGREEKRAETGKGHRREKRATYSSCCCGAWTMASSESKNSTKPASKAKTSRSSPSLLKVVIRRLPHQMKEEEFVTALVAATADAGMGERGGSWDLMYFTPGKMSKKRGRVTGTAYLHIDRGRGASADLGLINLRAAVLASDALTPSTGPVSAASSTSKDRDGGGKQSGDTSNTSAPTAAVPAAAGPTVEAAPFQKLFKQKPKRDIRVGTIEKDADYKAFCTALQSSALPLPSADVQADIKESEGKEEPKPQNALLDFLKERGAKRVRDSQRAAALGSSAHRGSGSSRRVSSSSLGGGAGSATTAAAAKTPVSASRATSGAAASSSSSSSRPPPSPSPSPQKSQKTSAIGTGVSVMSASYRATLAKAAAAAKTTTPTPAEQQGPSEASKSRSSSTKGGGGSGGGSGSRAASRGEKIAVSAAAPTPTPRILSRTVDSRSKPAAAAAAALSATAAASSARRPTASATPSSRSGNSSGGSGDGGKRGASGGKSRTVGKPSGTTSRPKK